jgi:hypothetical protein
MPGSLPATPLHPRRTSFLTSSRPSSATIEATTAAEPGSVRRRGQLLQPFGNDSLSLMSPLRPPPVVDLSGAAVTSLRAGGGGSGGGRAAAILGYSSGHLLRLVLPPLATNLVGRALAAVKQLLPRELALQLHSAWYSGRHAPGPALGPAEEWRFFCKCLLALAGYQVWTKVFFGEVPVIIFHMWYRYRTIAGNGNLRRKYKFKNFILRLNGSLLFDNGGLTC